MTASLLKRFCRTSRTLPLGQANRSHTVMDSAWPQSPLSNFKAAPLAAQHILDRNANILQLDFAMTMRRIVLPKPKNGSAPLRDTVCHSGTLVGVHVPLKK